MVFFHLLRRVERRYGWRIHVSCLMGNHYHLVLETPAPQPGQGNARPERRLRPATFNERHGRKDRRLRAPLLVEIDRIQEQYEIFAF